LLNAALRLPLAIVSAKPQTTRQRLLAIVRHRSAEIELVDTPGLHQPKTRLGKEMNRAARSVARDSHAVVLVTAVSRTAPSEPHAEDLRILERLPEVPIVLVINKIDLLRAKSQLLPLIARYSVLRELAAIVPISALRTDGIELVLDEVVALLPPGPPRHADDELTDRPLRYFAAEYVREPILAATSQEVPHGVAVTVERFEEPPEGKVIIEATIHVERPSHKGILIGEGGSMLKRIGSRARERIEELMGRQVHLTLWVKVTRDWRERPDRLHEFGLVEGRGSTPLGTPSSPRAPR
jgi:GTP-binding protein Era